MGRGCIGKPAVDLFPLGDGKAGSEANEEQEEDPEKGAAFGRWIEDDAFDAGFIAGKVAKGRIGPDIGEACGGVVAIEGTGVAGMAAGGSVAELACTVGEVLEVGLVKGVGEDTCGRLFFVVAEVPVEKLGDLVRAVMFGGVHVVFKIKAEFFGGLVAFAFVAFHALHDDAAELGGDGGVVFFGGSDGRFEDGLDGFGFVFAFEEASVGGHLVEDDPEGEDIGRRFDGLSRDLLGGHIAESSFEHTSAGAVFLGGGFGDTEVDDLDDAVEGDQEVVGADVAVDDAEGAAHFVGGAVGVVESCGGLGDDASEEVKGRILLEFFDAVDLFSDAFEVEATDVFHGDVVDVADLADFEDLNDVGVLEMGGNASFIEKHLDEVVAGGEVREDAFDDNGLADPCKTPLFGEEQLSHPAGCKFGDDLVVAK